MKVSVSELKPGMRLAKDVFIKDGTLLLLSGFIIKPRYIERLEFFEVPYVYVEEENEVKPAEEISEEKIYLEAVDTIKSILTTVRSGKELDAVMVKNTVNSIVYSVIDNEDVMLRLSGIRDIDNYTYLHCIDVCIYSVILGKSMGMSRDELTELGTAAVLHDIGKCKVPVELLKKPDSLTDKEFTIMKMHTVYGHEIITSTSGLNKRIANVAYQHHEKWDGTGYPLGLSKNTIDEFARIVTISDIYDALTAKRVYKARELPHEAVEYIIGNSSKIVDPQIAKIFLRSFKAYPENVMVLLNTGEIGSIVRSTGNMPIRPKVNVIARKSGPPVFEPYTVDLMKQPSVFIVEVIG